MKDSKEKRKPGRPKSPYKIKTVSFRIREHWEKEFRSIASSFRQQATLNDERRGAFNSAVFGGKKPR